MKRPKTLSPSFVKAVSDTVTVRRRQGQSWPVPAGKENSKRQTVKNLESKAAGQWRLSLDRFGFLPCSLSGASAAKAALENKQAAVAGRDPRHTIPTLAESVERVIAIHAAGWRDGGKSEKQWRSSLGTYVYPRIGDKPINHVSTADLLAVLTPVWNKRPETARRIKQRLGKVMKWAIAESYRESDPTTALAAALPKHSGVRQHHKALPYAEVGASAGQDQSKRGTPHYKAVFLVHDADHDSIR